MEPDARTLLIVTDAWEPQTNGVVTTLRNVIREIRSRGAWNVRVIHPGLFASCPLPSYPEIRVARTPWRLASMIPDDDKLAVHIATEGPLGLAARRCMIRSGIPFVTSLHTKFPEYLRQRTGIPERPGYWYLRWFHRAAAATLVTTQSHRRELEARGLRNLVVWGRGVDTTLFRPCTRAPRERPKLLYVGRISVEKNIEAFLNLDFDADKIVVGDGPARAQLQAQYPECDWVGYRRGTDLVRHFSDADVFVFPSRTDTFGLVMLEAMASGTPVAAYPVTGPADVVVEGVNGALDDDLGRAVVRALEVDRSACREFAERNSWRAVADRLTAQFERRRDEPPIRRPWPSTVSAQARRR